MNRLNILTRRKQIVEEIMRRAKNKLDAAELIIDLARFAPHISQDTMEQMHEDHEDAKISLHRAQQAYARLNDAITHEFHAWCAINFTPAMG